MTNYYQNKLAFITGGSEGIGRSIALQLVSLGADVVITSRSIEKCEKAFQELQKQKKNPAQRIAYSSFDLTDVSATQKNLEELITQFGVPDFLINCAGYARPGYLEELDLTHIKGMMEINYFGTVHAVQTILPYFIKKKSGTIVNTSSITGFIGLFGYTGYCASKYAVIGFSEALRREVAPYGIKVSVLCPPNTQTPGLLEENKSKPAEVLATEEKIKVLTPDEVAQAFLKKLPKNHFLITTTFDGTLSLWLSRWAPWIIDLFVRRK
jgi:3-dehydrosphinganine reductase